MYFNVSQLLKEPNGSVRSYEVDDSLLLTGALLATGITGKVEMLRTDKGIWVSAALETMSSFTCSRCLAEYEHPLHMDIEEEFIPEIDVFNGARLHHSEEFDENFYIDHNHILDLREAIRQYFDLSTPMKPVCRKNCNGICLTCGVNLNETSCVCKETPIDPRWDALLELVSAREQDN